MKTIDPFGGELASMTMTPVTKTIQNENAAPRVELPNVLADTFAQFGLTGLYDGKAKKDAS